MSEVRQDCEIEEIFSSETHCCASLHQWFPDLPNEWMTNATATIRVSASIRSEYATSLLARSNRAANRLIPIPTRIKGPNISLQKQRLSKRLPHTISADIQHNQTNGRTQAKTQKEYRISRIVGLKLRSGPDQEAGWDHKEAREEDVQQCVAESPHPTGCLGWISEFLQMPPKSSAAATTDTAAYPRPTNLIWTRHDLICTAVF